MSLELLNYKFAEWPVPVSIGESEFHADAELSGKRVSHAAGIFHFRSGRHESGLSRDRQRHLVDEVLLPARSDDRAVWVLLGSRDSIQHLDAGSQVASITNTQSFTPHFSIAEVFGFIREKIYSTIAQPFTPQAVGINAFGSSVFPGITIVG